MITRTRRRSTTLHATIRYVPTRHNTQSSKYAHTHIHTAETHTQRSTRTRRALRGCSRFDCVFRTARVRSMHDGGAPPPLQSPLCARWRLVCVCVDVATRRTTRQQHQHITVHVSYDNPNMCITYRKPRTHKRAPFAKCDRMRLLRAQRLLSALRVCVVHSLSCKYRAIVGASVFRE